MRKQESKQSKNIVITMINYFIKTRLQLSQITNHKKKNSLDIYCFSWIFGSMQTNYNIYNKKNQKNITKYDMN